MIPEASQDPEGSHEFSKNDWILCRIILVSGVFYSFLIHCKLDVCLWDITFYLPEYLLGGTQISFGRDGK